MRILKKKVTVETLEFIFNHSTFCEDVIVCYIYIIGYEEII